jgi:hypothetical protein
MLIYFMKSHLSGIMAGAAKNLIRSVIPDVLHTALNPIVEVPNGGWGQTKNLTLSVISSPIVNETGFYCRVRLDENGLPPFAELQDDTLSRDSLDDDCCEHGKYWDVKNPEDIAQ